MKSLATYVLGHAGSGYCFDKTIEVENTDPEIVGSAVSNYIKEYFSSSLIVDVDTGLPIVPTYMLSVNKGGFSDNLTPWRFFEKNPDKGVYLPTIVYFSSFFNPEKGAFWSDESTAKTVIEFFAACVGVPCKSKEEIKVKVPIEMVEALKEIGMKLDKYIEAKLITLVLNQFFPLNSLAKEILNSGLEFDKFIVPTTTPCVVSLDGLMPVVALPKMRMREQNGKFYSVKIDKRLTSYVKDLVNYLNRTGNTPQTPSKFISDIVTR